MLKPRIVAMNAHIQSLGVSKAALVGFCWYSTIPYLNLTLSPQLSAFLPSLSPLTACCIRGGWVLANILSCELADSFVCGAIPHPSITLEQAYTGGKPADLMSKVRKPLLLMPAQNDPDGYREGGELFEAVIMNNPTSATIDFPTMTHGWVMLPLAIR